MSTDIYLVFFCFVSPNYLKGETSGKIIRSSESVGFEK